MKSCSSFLFTIYFWIVAFPILMIVTPIVAIFTIILSPIFPNYKISYFPARFWGRLFCFFTFVKVEIKGLEFIQQNQSYIFVCNHQSVFDIFVIYGWLPSVFKWIMKIELRKIPLVGKACESAGHVFINRSNPIAIKKSIENAENQICNGVSLVIFPEGTRTNNGKMQEFKKGAFRIATDLQLPIIPITICGAYERLPRNSFHIKPGKIKLIFHKAINTIDYIPDKTHEIINTTWLIINADLDK